MGSSPASREAIENETFLSFGTDRLRRLCRAVDMHDEEARIVDAFGRLSRPWNRWVIGARPRWYPSILSDDHAPSSSRPRSPGESRDPVLLGGAGRGTQHGVQHGDRLSVLSELAGRHDLPLARWDAIKDLFLPEQPRGLFTLLFGVTWGRGRAPKFKIYLNPYVALRGHALADGGGDEAPRLPARLGRRVRAAEPAGHQARRAHVPLPRSVERSRGARQGLPAALSGGPWRRSAPSRPSPETISRATRALLWPRRGAAGALPLQAADHLAHVPGGGRREATFGDAGVPHLQLRRRRSHGAATHRALLRRLRARSVSATAGPRRAGDAPPRSRERDPRAHHPPAGGGGRRG